MVPFLNLPVKIVRLFTSNVAESEVAAGVCMGLFLGFIPLNGPMAILLFLMFLLFKINRLATMLVLPVFKLLYVSGVYHLADLLGGLILIDASFLAGFWRIINNLPLIAFLDLGNTLVSGGLLLSVILVMPVYIGAKTGVKVLREKYFDRIKGSKFFKWLMKVPVIAKAMSVADKAGGM